MNGKEFDGRKIEMTVLIEKYLIINNFSNMIHKYFENQLKLFFTDKIKVKKKIF
jgi:hypothetical protein